ncbi:hypothetical protein [Nocardioides sp. LHG3406-4]|uniref:hypothetical protein n=1 Tax=Nocardioides sp. LHG3406-4 TaxID=2804575 RepID=UPI003CFA400B
MPDALQRGAAALAVAIPFVLGFATTGGPPEADERDVVFHFTDPDIVESSGLALVGDRFVTVNDSGDSARVFVVDPATGDTTDEVTWPGEADDVEAVAPAGRDAVWVGDIGDNTNSRSSVSVRRVPLDGSPGEGYELRYPDGARDAEALVTHPRTGQLFVISKAVFGGQLYAAPRELTADGPNRLAAVGDVTGIVTDAAFFPDGRHLIVRTYTQALVYSWPSLESVGSFELPRQQQGEGIAVSPDGEVFVSSEGQRAPVLKVTLPDDVRRAMAAPAASPSASPSDASEADATAPAAEGRPVLPWVTGFVLFGLVVFAGVRASRRPR